MLRLRGIRPIAWAWLIAFVVACAGSSGDDAPGGGGGTGGPGTGGTAGSGGGGAGGTPIDAKAPELLNSDPQPGASIVWTYWPTLTFAEPVDEAVLPAFSMACDGQAHPISAHRLDAEPETVVINPEGDLPFEAGCDLEWPGPTETETLSFSVIASLPSATVPYDRSDASQYAPFPDDVWLEPDASTPTGARVELPVPNREIDVRILFGALNRTAGSPNGFSPLGALVAELSDAPDEDSLPTTPAESLDPFATIGLFDIDPDSAQYGQRVPFQLHIRSVRTESTPLQHTLVIFPSIPLVAEGQYGLVVTRRALADAGQPYDPSSFTVSALNDPVAGENAAVAEVRPLIEDVMDVVSEASPPLFADDVALVTRLTVRSNEALPITPLTMKEQVLGLSAPSFQVTSTAPGSGDVAAIVSGTWEAPEWREGDNISRDAQGRPVIEATKDIPFVLAIPNLAESEPVPVVMHQHGNPGTAEVETPRAAETYLAENGFAVIGFSDTITREVGPDIEAQVEDILTTGLTSGQLPDYWSQATGEQLSMLRLIGALGSLDVVPLGAPDDEPDLDVTAALSYVGNSEGANKGQALVPYAPEIRAAALVAGGSRLTETFFFQDVIGPDGVGTRWLDIVNEVLAPNARPLDLYVGWGILQLGFDPQDPQNHAAFMYDDPLEVAGTFEKPSVLVQEGIADLNVPNNASRSLAYTLGQVPQLEPIWEVVPYLPQESGPLRGNINAQTTAAHSQYVPDGIPGLDVTPGCEGETNGHYCVQRAPSSMDQRAQFFRSAVEDAVPTIASPE